VGQPVAVTEKPSSSPGIVRFELNRALTGMGHEHFWSVDDAFGPRPAAELARRLFATGQVAGVHVYSNIVTVDLGTGQTANGLADVVRDLYQYWKPGMEPPVFEEAEPAAEEGGEPAVIGADSANSANSASDAALSEAAKRVPAHLLERSRAARERWKAKQAG
jgi:hypothetical protein